MTTSKFIKFARTQNSEAAKHDAYVFVHARSPYHNSIHAADVLMSTHLFLSTFKLVDRLSKSDLLAMLVAAIVHDYCHPCATARQNSATAEVPTAFLH